jgi:hypothetical protein
VISVPVGCIILGGALAGWYGLTCTLNPDQVICFPSDQGSNQHEQYPQSFPSTSNDDWPGKGHNGGPPLDPLPDKKKGGPNDPKPIIPPIIPGHKSQDISDPENWNGCEDCAADIQAQIGGDIYRITPIDTPILGGYRGTNPAWGHHEVVVKDGRVYDGFGPAEGIPIEEYKNLWEFPEDINFGF